MKMDSEVNMHFNSSLLLNNQEVAFVIEHQNDDVQRLRLKYLSSATADSDFRAELCINAIEARAKIRNRLPHWYAHPQLLYPVMLSTQQCSSEATAEYKRELVRCCLLGDEGSLTGADLTGGMGVDSLRLSSLCSEFLYVERNAALCQATQANFRLLLSSALPEECQGNTTKILFKNSEVSPANIEDILGHGRHYDFIFIDPARRSALDSSKKVVELTEYTPDIFTMKDYLLQHSRVVLVKVSPMADIKQLLRQLPCIRQIHIVSVQNDCKEILLLLSGEENFAVSNKKTDAGTDNLSCRSVGQDGSYCNVEIVAVNIADGRVQTFRYALGDEMKYSLQLPHREATCASSSLTSAASLAPSSSLASSFSSPANLADSLLQGGFRRLYEPGKSFLKCGAFALIARRFNLLQLGVSTHLFVESCSYTQMQDIDVLPVSEFQGKIWEIVEVVPFSKRNIKELLRKYPDSGITARNFPLKTNELLKMTGSKECGTHHIFFTTVGTCTKVMIVVRSSNINE